MKFPILVSLILWLTCASVLAQISEYKIRFKNDSLTLVHQGKPRKLNLAEKIDAARVTDAEILFASRKGNFTYLVLAVSGQSRDRNFDRQCGAGIESNLIWLKLDSKQQIAEAVSERYESCWSSIDAGEGYKINGSVLTIEFDNFRDDVIVKLTYNAEAPEKGFQKETKPLEKP